MRLNNLLLLFISILFIELNINSELLILKKDKDGFFAPLNDSESLKYGNQISNIILKYQWPMCIASYLTEEEKNELLIADKPYAEEIFIQKKLKDTITDIDIYSAFIPTSYYELFCIWNFLEAKNQFFPLTNSFNKAVSVYIKDLSMHPNKKFIINLKEIINQKNLSPSDTYKKIYDVYSITNNLFFNTNEIFTNSFKIFSEKDVNAAICINNELVKWLLNFDTNLKNANDTVNLSNLIKTKSNEICISLIQIILQTSKKVFEKDDNMIQLLSDRDLKKIIGYLKTENKNNIIAKVIKLEYEAREKNKSLLLRGTKFEEFELGSKTEPKKQKLIGTTLFHKQRVNSIDQDIKLIDAYKGKTNMLYSISFGNSLFGGFLFDSEACAYYFLNLKGEGYGLFLNKAEYIDNKTYRLFFIPSLATIATLFTKGEYFHPRTTTAIFEKNENGQDIIGLLRDKLVDKNGVLIVTRDPLKHAELFSDFLSKNSKIIQADNEPKEIDKTIIKSQSNAANYYKSIRKENTQKKASGNSLIKKYKAIKLKEKDDKNNLINSLELASVL